MTGKGVEALRKTLTIVIEDSDRQGATGGSRRRKEPKEQPRG